MRHRKESLLTTMAYAFSDGWEDRVYRIDTSGRCNCDGHRNPRKGCKHTLAIADAIHGAINSGRWECALDIVMTPWAAGELGLTDTPGLDIRPTP